MLDKTVIPLVVGESVGCDDRSLLVSPLANQHVIVNDNENDHRTTNNRLLSCDESKGCRVDRIHS
jgi:hypothetical protein